MEITPVKVRVLIADDHPFMRAGVRSLLERSGFIQVVGEACNGKEALELVEDLTPDVLLLDIQMPVMDGIEVMDQLHQQGAKLKVLILSAFDDPYHRDELLSLGAWGYYLKEEAPNCIIAAIRQAIEGKP